MPTKKNIFIYFNYLVSFLGSIFFLVGANYLDLINIDKYIFLISISTIFASSIYASSIKSKLKGSVIMISFTKNSLKSLILLFFLISIYLGIYDKLTLIPVLLLIITYDLSYNLFAISFIKKNNTLNHSRFLFTLTIIKNLTLFLSIITSNFLIIVSVFNFIFIVFFFLLFSKLKIKFEATKKPFNSVDLAYIFLGSLVFQIDKILGENFLTKENYFTYFLIFKFASIFQIIGSIITQPSRNEMISKETITKKLFKNLKNFIISLLVLLFISNFIFIFFDKIEFFNKYIFQINIINLIIFNILSLSIIAHIFNGFYIDVLFIKNYGKILMSINFITLLFIIVFLINFKSLIIWSTIMFTSQIIITFLALVNYKKYA